MRNYIIVFISFIIPASIIAQKIDTREIHITVLSKEQAALPNATVVLLKTGDSSIVKSAFSDSSGIAVFRDLNSGSYTCRISSIDYINQTTPTIDLINSETFSVTVVLEQATGILNNVTVTARKPFVQHLPDKTIVNVEAGITNAGTTVMEVLEKSPGITIDRDGNISMKGKSGVQVMIDGKPTQVSGADLSNILSGMSASSIELIELMDNPPARYDAAGNAGIINIRTKKNKQHGFNGSVTTAYGQGIYPKSNNNLLLNYRTRSFNFFVNYSLNANTNFIDMYALRTYYKSDGSTVDARLEQPFYTKHKTRTHTIKTGMDYYLNSKTTAGIAVNGLVFDRNSDGRSNASWLNENNVKDSMVATLANNKVDWNHGGLNFNLRHVFDANRELTADVDYLGYDINSAQYFENRLNTPGAEADISKGDLVSGINIFTAKIDYSQQIKKARFETGLKTSRIATDNIADYFVLQNGGWQDDLGKSNHFLYTENIHAAYASVQAKSGNWDFQGGLRYEYTSYKAKQLGNAAVKDSSFNRSYHSLFPTLFITYRLDSSNSFTFSGGQRIDRPGFQKLNPFVYIINKYTLQRGNPYYLPQYTWNVELTHLFKEVLSTNISYSTTRDYFSQIFTSDTSTGTIVYTEGNVGRAQVFGFGMSLQLSPFKWWSLTGQGDLTHKKLEGQLWKNYKAAITQFSFSVNNQFRLNKGWGAELTGFYIGKNQNDLQEVLDPTGQVSVGLSKQVFKNKGSVKLSFRDIFYTQNMQGLTHFQSVVEFFTFQRDSRVLTLSLNYRFGKTMKQPAKRSAGSASDEINRVGNAN